MVKPTARRVLVGHLRERYRISERRACIATRFCRVSVRYHGKPSAFNGALLARIKEIAAARIRYGYRRVHVLLRREGWPANVKRVARLYRIEGLSLREQTHKRRKSANVRQPRTVVTAANQVWSLDFMHDRLADEARRAYRLLTIVDVHTRERLALEQAFSFRAIDVITVLNKIITQRGCSPQSIRCDNGTEFTATAFDQWAYANDVMIDYSSPGKPTDNAFIESFNGRVRQELLNGAWFTSIEEARRACRAWGRDYNENRPHRSLGNITPVEFARAEKSRLTS